MESVKFDHTVLEDESWLKLFGAWKNEPESAEEIIEKIKASRLTNRTI